LAAACNLEQPDRIWLDVTTILGGAAMTATRGAALDPIGPRVSANAVLAREFEAFVRTRTPSLLRSAYLLTGDQQLAEDLVQSALIRTHRSWRNLHDAGNAEAYTRKIMYNLQVSWWRRGRVAESLAAELPDHGLPGEDLAHGAALRLSLQQALLRLGNKQRAVLVLRFFEDRSEAEIAGILGVSPGTVKSQAARALARLRELAPELSDRYFPEGVTR
jgi:RNA polymerase sigma-70 factor (sigma-E family)